MRSSNSAPLRESAAHVFVDDLDAPALDPDDEHHLARVLRLRPGEAVSVSDGQGGWRAGAWTGSSVDPTGEVQRDRRPAPSVTIGVPLLKGDRTEWAVQKLVEVGVDTVVPLVAARTVVRSRNVARLRRVAREAAMQSRRTWLPEVKEIVPFAELVTRPEVAMAEPGGEPPSLDRPCVLVGPEGGWAPEELAAAVPRTALGLPVLRAETAAVAAGVLLCALRGNLVGEIST